MRGKVGKESYLEDWSHKISGFTAESVEFDVTFEWDESIGHPGAFFIKNHHHSEFFLKTLILEDVSDSVPAHFVCNSWVYHEKYYKYTRILFANQSYLTSNTPEPLRKYREDELKNLRGDRTGELQAWDRVCDYAVYNDVGVNRPILGGQKSFLILEGEGLVENQAQKVSNMKYHPILTPLIAKKYLHLCMVGEMLILWFMKR